MLELIHLVELFGSYFKEFLFGDVGDDSLQAGFAFLLKEGAG